MTNCGIRFQCFLNLFVFVFGFVVVVVVFVVVLGDQKTENPGMGVVPRFVDTL